MIPHCETPALVRAVQPPRTLIHQRRLSKWPKQTCGRIGTLVSIVESKMRWTMMIEYIHEQARDLVQDIKPTLMSGMAGQLNLSNLPRLRRSILRVLATRKTANYREKPSHYLRLTKRASSSVQNG